MLTTMCSIPGIEKAVREMHRVLKPNGRLLFVEHGLAPEPRVRWWQDHLTPLWKRCSGGCHLNRPIDDIIQSAGFHIEHLDTAHVGGPKPMTFMYEGTARPRPISLIDRVISEKRAEEEQAMIARNFEKLRRQRTSRGGLLNFVLARSCRPRHDRGARWGGETGPAEA
jgi:SAM-dependent methyltransferase